MRANSLLAGEERTTRHDDIAIASSVKSVLVIDVGGSSIKILATGQTERRSFPSGPTLTPDRVGSLTEQKDFLLAHGFLPGDFDVDQWVDEKPLLGAQDRLARAGRR